VRQGFRGGLSLAHQLEGVPADYRDIFVVHMCAALFGTLVHVADHGPHSYPALDDEKLDEAIVDDTNRVQ
jgi:hypothetical protein